MPMTQSKPSSSSKLRPKPLHLHTPHPQTPKKRSPGRCSPAINVEIISCFPSEYLCKKQSNVLEVSLSFPLSSTSPRSLTHLRLSLPSILRSISAASGRPIIFPSAIGSPLAGESLAPFGGETRGGGSGSLPSLAALEVEDWGE